MTDNIQQLEVDFYKAMHDWAADGKVSPDPRSLLEYRPNSSTVWSKLDSFHIEAAGDYRWRPAKKRTVIIDGVELVAPEVVVPVQGNRFFYAISNSGVVEDTWVGDLFDSKVLANGKVFLTREDCQAMSDAQRKQRLGGGV